MHPLLLPIPDDTDSCNQIISTKKNLKFFLLVFQKAVKDVFLTQKLEILESALEDFKIDIQNDKSKLLFWERTLVTFCSIEIDSDKKNAIEAQQNDISREIARIRRRYVRIHCH